MTDNEIVKALETCCIERVCSKCSYSKNNSAECINDIMKDTLDLINRLQAEKQDLEIELQAMRGAANSYKAEVERLKAKCENTQIGYNFAEDEIKNLKKDKYKLQKALNQSEDYRVIAKAEAYKEFAERLCEDRVSNDPVVIAAKVELKELVGDNQ